MAARNFVESRFRGRLRARQARDADFHISPLPTKAAAPVITENQDFPKSRMDGVRVATSASNVSAAAHVTAVCVEKRVTVPRAGGTQDANAARYVKKEVFSHAPTPGACMDDKAGCACSGTVAPGSSMFHKTIKAKAAPVPLSQLLKSRWVYNVRKAPPAVLKSMMSQAYCRPDSVKFTLHGRNSMQLRTELKRQLARELAAGCISDRRF